MILVTGATGFVGRHIIRELAASGQPLRCLVRPTSNLTVLQGVAAEVCQGDVSDLASLEAAVNGVQAIVHLAAVIRERGSVTFQRVNVTGTENIVRAATAAGTSRFLFMSNLGAGPDPTFPFLRSKWHAEELLKASGLNYTILRSSVMFGEGDGFVCVLAALARRLPLMPVIGAGKTKFQLIAVTDVARCVALALQDEAFSGRTIELGGPEHLSYEEIIDTVQEALAVKRLKLHIPIFLMRPLVWAMDRLLAEPPVTPGMLAMLKRDNIADRDAVENDFGFAPLRLREGIACLRSPR